MSFFILAVRECLQSVPASQTEENKHNIHVKMRDVHSFAAQFINTKFLWRFSCRIYCKTKINSVWGIQWFTFTLHV